jgi:hypothetical protein
MPALLAPALLSLAVSAGLTPSYQASVRAETRAEQVRPPVGENTTTDVFEVEPRIGLSGSSRDLRLELVYAPRFTHVGGDGPDSDTWLQVGWLTVRWRPTAAWKLQANMTATAGTVDLFRVVTAPARPGDPPPVGQPAPVASSLDYRRYQLELSTEGRLRRRLDLLAGVIVMREGGANAAEREILPLQQAALVRGVLSWRLSARNSLAGALTASVTHYFDVAVASGVPGESLHQSWSNWLGRAEAIWRYRLTSHTGAWAGAGLTHINSDAPGTVSTGLQPMGEVGLSQESGPGWPRLSGGVLAAVWPLEDRLSGTVAQRAEARAWGAWSVSKRWALGASALGARVMNGPSEREAFTAGEMWATRTVRGVLMLTAGGRWTTQWPVQTSGLVGLPTSRWVAYLSIQAFYTSRPVSERMGPIRSLTSPLL